MANCDYNRLPDGRWKCSRPECGDETSQPRNRPPLRNCGALPAIVPQDIGTYVAETMDAAIVDARSRGLGDVTADALAAAGITKERVSRWIGAPCNCAERQEKLNRLGRWIAAVATGDWCTVQREAEAEIGQEG